MFTEKTLITSAFLALDHIGENKISNGAMGLLAMEKAVYIKRDVSVDINVNKNKEFIWT